VYALAFSDVRATASLRVTASVLFVEYRAGRLACNAMETTRLTQLTATYVTKSDGSETDAQENAGLENSESRGC